MTWTVEKPDSAAARRLWSGIDVGGGGCKLWTRSTTTNGYGKLTWPRVEGGWRLIGAHVATFIVVHQRLPVGVVRHRCDTPPCCNPDHLLDGTQSANLLDSVERGRWGDRDHRGERNPRATLGPALVYDIRAAADQGVSVAQIARRYGVGYQAAWKIARRRTWRHLPEDVAE